MTQPIVRFDKPTLRALRSSLDRALEGVATLYGIRVRVGNAKFTDTTADFRLELVVDRPATADGKVPESKEAQAFRQLAPVYGFTPADLGATVLLDEPFRIIGARPAAPKRPILLASIATGRRVVAPPTLVRVGLDAARRAA